MVTNSSPEIKIELLVRHTNWINVCVNMNKNNNNIMEKNMELECDICGEYINKSTRKKITCPYEYVCGKMCCSSCFRRFLLDSQLNPVCMWCKKDISKEFIQDNSTQKFYKKYIEYKTSIIFDLQKGRLSELQEMANTLLQEKHYWTTIRESTQTFDNIKSKIEKIKSTLEICCDSLEMTVNPFAKGRVILIIRDSIKYLDMNDHLCSLCDIIFPTSILHICATCYLKKCNQCVRLCLLANDTKCVNCDTSDEVLFEEFIKTLPKSFYIKFFKPKKRRQNAPEMEPHRLRIIECVKEKKQLNDEIYAFHLKLYNIRYGIDWSQKELHEGKKEREKFIKKCPNNECRGFLSSFWKCGICNQFFCKDCHMQKVSHNDIEHICNESEKATIAMLKKNTKPCPLCNIPIDRWTGCRQVWTPCCKIAFDWETGKIDTGRVHSPEYYDYIRRINNGIVPREVDDNPCDAIVEIATILYTFRKNSDKRYMKYHQHMIHIRLMILPTLLRDPVAFFAADLGLFFLIIDITER